MLPSNKVTRAGDAYCECMHVMCQPRLHFLDVVRTRINVRIDEFLLAVGCNFLYASRQNPTGMSCFHVMHRKICCVSRRFGTASTLSLDGGTRFANWQ